MSRLLRLPPFQNVAASSRASVRLNLGVTYEKIHLQLGGTLTKALITNIEAKLNSKLLMKAIGSDLDAMMGYRGFTASANFLTLDFTERDAPDIAGKMMGTIAATGEAGVQDFTLELDVGAGATHSLVGWAEVGAPSANRIVSTTKQQQKVIAAAAEETIFVPRGVSGAQVKRIFIFGANIADATVRRNGVDWFQVVPKAVLDWAQLSNRRVNGAGYIVLDFIQDGLQSGALNTAFVVGPDGKQVAVDDVDVRVRTTAASTLTVYTEMYTTNDRI
jgi:hypothetical protein